MRTNKYSSDLSAKHWQVIEKLLIVQRKSRWPLKDMVDAIFYVTKNGCVWRDLPADFPVWQTVYWYFRKWARDGIWERINGCLIVDHRAKMDKNAQPTVAIIDSQSVKNSPTCTEDVGIDGGKLVKGRKRFYIVGTLGNLLDSFVTPANCHDGTTAAKYWQTLSLRNVLLENVEKVYADGTFGGTFGQEMGEKMGITVEIPQIAIAQKGKVPIHEKRWIVERTIAWTLNNRRCAKDYERKVGNANAYLIIANIRRVVRKI
ncbi:MAG: IS5 family transposase [Bernardetiaceae bacterium]|jgi:putative transposase|nr:IS5 family transposase [Bernardetiaceae bacterium]